MTEFSRPSVFVNCPFDDAFKALFDALVFAVLACGYRVRNALEASDSGELRLQKICRLIGECRFSIHDLSRVELDGDSGLPRFNMPIELGIALGLRAFGSRRTQHSLLVFDSEQYRYQTFASDLAGLDIAAHGNDPTRVIAAVRNFFAPIRGETLPSPKSLITTYRQFELALPAMAAAVRQDVDELTFGDRLRHAELFLAPS